MSESTHSLNRWIKVTYPEIAMMLQTCFQSAPHPLVDGVLGVCVRLNDIASIALLIPDYLLPSTVARAVPSRRTAFVAGRLCAEHAAIQLGHDGFIDVGPSGEPVWPVGLVGSITHNELLASSVVALSVDLYGVGIDSEIIVHGDARHAIESVCCSEWERQTWVARAADGMTATLVFSAKEALYKAIYPSIQRFVDFLEVEVAEIDWSRGVLEMRAVRNSILVLPHPLIECRFVYDKFAVHVSVFFRQRVYRGELELWLGSK